MIKRTIVQVLLYKQNTKLALMQFTNLLKSILYSPYLYFLPQVLVPWVGADGLYRGSVTHVCVACHTQIVVTIPFVVVKSVDRYLKRRLKHYR